MSNAIAPLHFMEFLPPVITILAWIWLLVRILGRRDLHHMLRGSRRIRVIAGGAVSLGIAGGLGAFLGPPALQWTLAGISLVCLVAFVATTSPRRGRRRGLPPGSLDLISQMDQVDDRFLLKLAERHGPVFKTTRTWDPAVCVVGIDQITKLLEQHDRRLSRGEMLYSTLIPHGFLRYMGFGETRRRYRPLLAQTLAPGFDNGIRDRATEALRLELERMQAQSSAGPVPGVLPQRHLPGAMLRTFITVIFGAWPNSSAMADLEALYDTLNCRRLVERERPAARRALGELNEKVRALVDPRDGIGEDGSFRNLVMKEPDLLADDTLVGNLVAMVQVGSFDHASLLAWIWKYLSDFPDWRDRLRRDLLAGHGTGRDGLAARIVSETLRLDQSEYLKRTALEDLHFQGYRIPKGWGVEMCLRESHQDPSHFASPRHFNPDRFLEDPSPRGYAPFGVGSRRCPGQTLTLVLSVEFLRLLVSGYDWRVLDDGPRHHDGIHWAPSEKFRIHLTHRAHQA